MPWLWFPPQKKLLVGDFNLMHLVPGDSDEIITNSQGGQQSKLEARYDLLPPTAITIVAEVLDYGAKRHAPNNWRKIPVEDHLNHALAHLFSASKFLLRRKKKEAREELSHAACRVLFALDMI